VKEHEMNVVRLVDYFPSLKNIHYGLGPAFYYLSREQAKLGVNVSVICKRRPSEKKFEEIEGIRVYRVLPPYNISALYKLAELSKRIRVDLVHAHATALPFYALLRKLIFSSQNRAKYVIHVHATGRGSMLACKKFLPEIFARTNMKRYVSALFSHVRQSIMWERGDELIAVSYALSNELERLYGIPRTRIRVIHNGVDLESFCPRDSRDKVLEKCGLDPGSFVLLYLGGFRPIKGPRYLIEALERIPMSSGNIKVLFVGNPRHPLESFYVRYIMNLIKHLKVEKRVSIIRNIPYPEMPEYFSASDALVLPSLYDSFPKVALEAMACRTPVIASAVGGLNELIVDGKTGILVKPGDPHKLAEAILKIASDTTLKEKLGSNGRRLVADQFTWNHAATRTLTLYQKLLRS